MNQQGRSGGRGRPRPLNFLTYSGARAFLYFMWIHRMRKREQRDIAQATDLRP